MAGQPDAESAVAASAPIGEFHAARFEAAAEDVLAQLAPSPVRCMMAAQLVLASIWSENLGPGTPTERLYRLDRMAAAADPHPPTHQQWQAVRLNLRIEILVRSVLIDQQKDPGAGLRELEDIALTAGQDPDTVARVNAARARLTLYRDFQQGYQSSAEPLHSAVDEMARLADPQDAELYAKTRHKVIDALVTDDIDPDTVRAMKAMGDVWQRLTREGAGGFPRDMRAALGMLQADADDPSVPEAVAANLLVSAAHDPHQRALLQVMVGAAEFMGDQEADAEALTRAIEHFDAAQVPPDSPVRMASQVALALGLIQRGRLTNDLADTNRAAEIMAEARRAAGGPHHPLWPLINGALATAETRLGNPESHAIGLDGLRGRAWQVLLQDDPAAARALAARAAQDAMATGRLSLAANDVAAALRALDGGRALMLFSAVELGDVAPRLEAAGRGDLAERWHRSAGAGEPDRMPTNLRADVLTALTGRSGLLDPPQPSQIRQALARLGADTLVYLIPGEGKDSGWAVFAPVQGPMGYLALPGLRFDEEQDLSLYLQGLPRRDLSPDGPRPDLPGSLDALCDWAWRAAIGPILDECLPAGRPAGRPPRIVLVPMGNLALVPWQAARRRDGTFALELAAFSQTPSARMLCRSAQLPPAPPGPVGLVVGDPDTGDPRDRLDGARLEAFAIHRAFYRDGRYLGLRADGTPSPAGRGSAQELRAWLEAESPGAGAVLHLACHGVVDTASQTPDSYLVLADGSRASARQIVQWTTRTPERAVGLAVLAACHTASSAQGYDEAYSLGTAFLAAGVRSVISAQWAVPDDATSALMFMVHHYMAADRLSAGDALRRAQLWMIDPARKIPPTMPSALSRRLGDADLCRLDAWAGFVHLGQ